MGIRTLAVATSALVALGHSGPGFAQTSRDGADADNDPNTIVVTV